jgi:mRNA interferase YafQ
MKYSVSYSNRILKDIKRLKKRGYDLSKFSAAIDDLLGFWENEIPLPQSYNDHALIGNWVGYRDCHIANDWILIYKADEEKLTLLAMRTGTHSDVF